ncbi:MAG TPA: hypothetical protein VMT38_04785 [Terracidiphilus sp.]|nr:hypothetical protein [Terracidiphilus sp.]
MKRTVFVYAVLAGAAALLGAQQASQSSQYTGTSNPPPDDTISTPAPDVAPQAKPSPGHYADDRPAAKTQHSLDGSLYTIPTNGPANDSPANDGASNATPANNMPPRDMPARNMQADPTDGTDDGIVQVAPDKSSAPMLNERAAPRDIASTDPDGDIVHPAPLPPGTLGEGAVIRVRLLDRLSSGMSEKGDTFRTRVVSDVIQDGQVLIPAGAEIDGRVDSVSTGHFAGHGSMRLQPEVVILADGSRFHLYGETTGAPGSNDHVGSEGNVTPGSRLKKAGVEYGAVAGAGVVTGAIIGGPGGALAGGIVGAGVVTVHLLVDHPQATLDDGTVLLFTLSEPLHLAPAAQTGN